MSAPVAWLRALAADELIEMPAGHSNALLESYNRRVAAARAVLEAVEAAKALDDLHPEGFGLIGAEREQWRRAIEAAVTRNRLALAVVWGES